MAKSLKSSDGTLLYHISKDHLGSVYCSFAVPKFSPYLPRINNIILRMLEAGFKQALTEYEGPELTRLKKYNGQDNIPLSLRHLEVIFILLIIGLFNSFLVFIMEMLCVNHKENALSFFVRKLRSMDT